MTIEYRLPQLGMGMQEGTIVEWCVAEGQHVTEGDPLVVIENAKAETEVEAPFSGTLASIRVPAGQTVPVQTLLAVFDEGP
ncbi:MAG: biotin/lipoyl-binding protein [Acidimicrobiales bacterium]|nr:biotin/lipoyl-binding protein [Acidimicrobiales bacterium]